MKEESTDYPSTDVIIISLQVELALANLHICDAFFLDTLYQNHLGKLCYERLLYMYVIVVSRVNLSVFSFLSIALFLCLC